MKRLSILRIAVAFVVLGLSGYAQGPVSAQKIFDSMIDALGGKAYLDAKEIYVSGRFFAFRKGELSASERFADFIKFPDKERTEFGKEKEKTVELHNGKNGWKLTPPAKGKVPDVQEMSIPDGYSWLDDFKTTFDYVPRFVATAPKTSLVLGGTDLVDFKRVDVLEIRDAQKNLMRIYVDRETHLPVKVQRRDAKESTVKEETFANWHKFDGVMTPMMVVSFKDGIKRQEVRAEKVAYNTGLPDSLFEPPAASSK